MDGAADDRYRAMAQTVMAPKSRIQLGGHAVRSVPPAMHNGAFWVQPYFLSYCGEQVPMPRWPQRHNLAAILSSGSSTF